MMLDVNNGQPAAALALTLAPCLRLDSPDHDAWVGHGLLSWHQQALVCLASVVCMQAHP